MYYDQSDDFFNEEVRCNWTIDKKSKKVWAVQLDLIKYFLNICDENNLKCFAIFGTLLGVVRHGGYIPWDDDIDFGMPRKDYDQFVSICAKGLKEPYFLQTTLSDIDSYEIHSSLRNSNTTGNCDFNMYKRCNNGIAIDIVPLDGVDSDFNKYKAFRRRIKFWSTLCNTYVNDVNKTKRAAVLRFILRRVFLNFPYKKYFLKNEEKLRARDYDTSEKVSTVLIADNTAEELFWDRKDFDEIIYKKFETIEIPIPAGYNNNLKTIYGNYMEFPPVEKRGNKHKIEYEPDVPYKEYCHQHYGVNYDDMKG